MTKLRKLAVAYEEPSPQDINDKQEVKFISNLVFTSTCISLTKKCTQNISTKRTTAQTLNFHSFPLLPFSSAPNARLPPAVRHLSFLQLKQRNCVRIHIIIITIKRHRRAIQKQHIRRTDSTQAIQIHVTITPLNTRNRRLAVLRARIITTSRRVVIKEGIQTGAVDQDVPRVENP